MPSQHPFLVMIFIQFKKIFIAPRYRLVQNFPTHRYDPIAPSLLNSPIHKDDPMSFIFLLVGWAGL
ncbi:MAG: hypothetical protein DRG76_01350 [Deltaproteobacteria bacterium]|nr:MAG: hypothetical protein DRG76_01350 [Deltaproteobacteria bacterium]